MLNLRRLTSLTYLSRNGLVNSRAVIVPIFSTQRRKYSYDDDDEDDVDIEEEEQPKKQKPPLVRPYIHPSLVPRRRNGLDVEKFLDAIGRDCVQYKHVFKDWTDLFTMKSRVMKLYGIPTKKRKWILHWVQLYRQGFTPEKTTPRGKPIYVVKYGPNKGKSVHGIKFETPSSEEY